MALLAGTVALGGCSEFRSAVGMEKTPPDEFSVRVRAPLSMPQDYGLKAPRPGAGATSTNKARDRAEQIIIESDKSRRGRSAPRRIKGLTRQETALITKLGGDRVSSNIRRTVESETAAINEKNKGFVDSIMFWKETPLPGKTVDPRKEARRIQENAALGRRADTGKTPVIERKSKGLFSQGLFKDWF
ncbi:MAG: DUF3035 domain-containing protein [Alphaproteobacteria bacterium]|nr:DUF3035 domain-containing protein [Alphaproteobacteria bacterium]